ncbi:hypothetical protein EsH8_III_001050 [Colletotrichum jinshuiense]
MHDGPNSMDPHMAFHGPLHGQSVVAGMSVSGGTANVHFHHAANGPPGPPSTPVRILPFARNEDVVIRPGIFSQLAQLLPVSEAKSAALYGLGGSGKTQIALEFAYRRAGDDSACSVFWVHADTEATFTQDYTLIARKAGLSNLHGEELLTAVCHFIEAQPRWLLVLDNADDLRLFGVGVAPSRNSTAQPSRSLYRFVPKGTSGSVLWTSRDKRVAGSLVGPSRAVEITSMLPIEAQALLAMTRGCALRDEELDDAAVLLSELHHIPLPVSQAAAYMRRTNTPVKKYVSRLQDGKKRWALLRKTDFDRHRREGISNSIFETWNITIEHLKQEDETAVKILYILAYIDNQNIPVEIIKAAADVSFSENISRSVSRENSCPNDDNAEDSDDSDDSVTEAITRLIEFSFLHMTISPNGKPVYDMHQLVQEATLFSHSVGNDRTNGACYSRLAIQILIDVFPDRRRENWEKCENCVPHILRAGNWAELAGEEIQVSNLLAQLSNYLYDRGQWWEKEKTDDRAYLLRQKAIGIRHPNTIDSLASLATTYHAQGRYSEAEKIKIEVLELRREVLGKRHPDTIASMANLATTYHGQGRYREAEKIKIEVLELHKEILGKRHPDTITSMASLATTYYKQGRYNEVEKTDIEVLELRQEILGKRHPDTIASMASLATTYHEQGRYREAEKIKIEVLELHKEILGKRHPDTIASMADLATTYYEQGRYTEAEKIYTEVLELRQEILGKRHPDTITSMAHLATTYHAQGRYNEVEKTDIEVLELRQEILGKRHPDTIASMANLATTYYGQGRYDEVEKINIEVLELRQEVLGNRHPKTIDSMTDLAATYYKQGKYAEAEKIHTEVLELRQEVLGKEAPQLDQRLG